MFPSSSCSSIKCTYGIKRTISGGCIRCSCNSKPKTSTHFFCYLSSFDWFFLRIPRQGKCPDWKLSTALQFMTRLTRKPSKVTVGPVLRNQHLKFPGAILDGWDSNLRKPITSLWINIFLKVFLLCIFFFENVESKNRKVFGVKKNVTW